jgi:hypothetical protein
MTARALLGGVVVGLLVVATPAFAQSYIRTQVPGKNICLAWTKRVYTFHVHSAGSSKTPQNAEFAGIDAAFQSWGQLAEKCSDFRFVKGQQVDTVTVGYKQGEENANILTFRETSCQTAVPSSDSCFVDGSCGNKYNCWDHSDGTIALTTTTFSFKSGTIYDADIEFNAAEHTDGESFLFTTVSSPPCPETSPGPLCVATDIQNTLTHELGHVVGLDHTDVLGSTMEPSAPLGETQKRIIDEGTAAGFCETYPIGATTPPCDATATISRRIYAINKGTNTGCTASGLGPLSTIACLALSHLWRRRRTAA